MNTLPVYILYSILIRIFLFLRNWYVASLIFISKKTVNLLTSLDLFFALKITINHIFSPLYQDYTLISYIISIPIRIVMIISAIIIYILVIILAITIYIMWSLIIPFIIYKIITPLLS